MAVMVETPPPQSIDRFREPPGRFEELCRILEQVDADLPDGYYTEIIGGQVIVSPWSQCTYELILDSLVDQLGPHAPEGHRARATPRLFRFPEQSEAYGPDLHITESTTFKTKGIYAPGEALSLVGEVTSPSTAHNDRRKKAEVYGKAGVPVYLLVDVLKELLVVYSEPSPERGYRTLTEAKFGETVHIPAPFDCELDTADWEV
ncbi:Uma2 family endonuclease [Streptomyces sp. NPDC002536]